MQQSLSEIQQLLREVAEHLQSPSQTDKNAAAAKLHRVAAIASTMAFTIKAATR
jgi:hypothetical protein